MKKEYTESLVSVVIPCYNVAPFVKRCLESLINNTYQKLELICVDDGSTDDTFDELQKIKDDRIIIIKQENQGLSGARNSGVEVAHGEFITYVDSDDWVHKDFVQRLVDAQKMTDADVVMCDYLRVEGPVSDIEIKTPVAPVVYNDLDVWNKTPFKHYVWRKLYKRSYIIDCSFLRGVKIEDILYNIDTFVANPGAKYAVIDDKLLYYYNRPGSLIRNFTGEDLLPISEGIAKAILRSPEDLVVVPAVETIKAGLAARYLSMFEPNYKEIKEKCSSFFDLALKNMKGRVSTIEYIRYSVFARFPFVYRCLRIMTDRTMRDWEKNQKLKHSNKQI